MALPYLFLPDHDDDPSVPRIGLARRDRRDRTAPDDGLPEDAIDRDRVLRVRAGDHDAYTALFMELHVPLREFAATYLRSAAVAEEIVQEVFLDLWVRRAAWAPRRGIRAYLFRAVRNRSADDVRHARVVGTLRVSHVNEGGRAMQDSTEPPVGMGEAPLLPGADTDIRDFAIALHRVLEQFPPARRRAALLRWRHGLRFAEIAEALGTSVASATMHVVRAREAIRPVIERFSAE